MKKEKINLIPNIVNPTPDYYCTWQTQLYATSDGKPEAQRASITEKSLFDNEKSFGWAYFYPEARCDLYFVMDDSWDVPFDDYEKFYGSMILNGEKFPSYADGQNPEKAYKSLSDEFKKLGWKGLGGWICAQESCVYSENITDEEYWKKRLQWAQDGGLVYLKLDWGKKAQNAEFRKWLTDMAHKIAPDVIIENAMTTEAIETSDVFRSYDVPALFSVPMTMKKLEQLLKNTAKSGYGGLINCEDELYIAAAIGCSFGAMRHPYTGALPNGREDMSFPSCHRNIKSRVTEIIRAARWHRIAPAFAVDELKTHFSSQKLIDNWQFINPEAEIESWWPEALNIDFNKTDTASSEAISAISRNMPLPKIETGNEIPFVVCSKNPSGAISIATLGRTFKRDFYTPLCDITINGETADAFGIFGYYKNLYINTSLNTSNLKVYAQDLAGDTAYDITNDVKICNGIIIIPGNVIEEIGCMENKQNDLSEPGLVLKLKTENI